jgi:hypothetical protein
VEGGETASAWFALVGALGGVLLAGLGGLSVAALNNRHARRLVELEHARQLRQLHTQERRQAYTDFLVSTNDVYQLAADLLTKARRKGTPLDFRKETGDAVKALMRSELALALVASGGVRTAAKEYAESLRGLLLGATRAEWIDETSQTRNDLFARMIADVQSVDA